jgi:hypothetical protein
MPLATSHEVKPPVWLSWEPSNLSWLDLDSPPWLAAKFPLRVFLEWFTYIVYCAFAVYCCIPTRCDSLPFVQSNILFKYFVSINFHFWSILFNYWSIIVQYSDPGNVFYVFRSRKEVTITRNLESININTSTKLAYFRISIGLLKAFCQP